MFVIFIFGCNSVSQSDYIASTSGGTIGVKMPLYIHLTDSLTIGNDALDKAISLSPNVKVKCTMSGSTTIIITPLTEFAYNTEYEVNVDLNVVSKNKEKGKFVFSFTTATPRYYFKENSLVFNGDTFAYSGEISTTDYVDSEYIEKNFKLTGANTPIQWAHTAEGTLHSYTIKEITPCDSPFTITLTSNYHQKNRVEIAVPRKGEYKILDCQVLSEPLSVVITFSDILNPVQRLDELITLDGDLRFNITDNLLIIYPQTTIVGSRSITISGSIENSLGKKLSAQDYTKELIFPEVEPSIKFIGKGSILPSSNNMSLLFQSVNYGAARIRVKKIYSNNLLQFFQSNDYEGNNNIDFVASVVKDTTIVLDDEKSPKLRIVTNYTLNLSELITADQGAMYRIEIKGEKPLTEEPEGYDYDYYFGDYRTYEARSRNILQSDLGIIAKGDDNGNYTIFATDLISARHLMECNIALYNSVNQLIEAGLTDGYGKVSFTTNEQPAIIVAEKDGNKSFLKIQNGLALSLSNFDVAGTNTTSAIKGFIFGERGVWRPGDDIYLTFMVTTNGESLPENHPATLEFRNPQGQLVTELTKTKSSDGIYTFKLKTGPDAPTGKWEAAISYGGETFKKTIRIETIKPNRLKIGFKLNDNPFVPANNIVACVNAKWLHGAIAKGFKVKVSAELSKTKTEFKGYEKFSFDDGSKVFNTEEKELLSGVTDSNGDVVMKGQLSTVTGNTAGMLNAKFGVKVFEPSGDFSVDQLVAKISPYDTYIGVGVDEKDNSWGNKYLDIKSKHTFKFVALDINGKLKPVAKVKVELYKMGWDWWWDAASENALASYSQNSYNRPYQTFTVDMNGGKGELPLGWSKGDWGRYLIRVTDEAGGHSATKVVTVDENFSRSNNGEVEAATRLSIIKNKDKYVVGDVAVVSIPSAKGAKALVSVESGSAILRTFWVDCNDGKTDVDIPIKEGMSPNIYAHIMMIQPHNNSLNDAPIRLYGVTKLYVEDKNRRLTPVINVPAKVRPEAEFSVTISEANGKAMSYVVAIVDEGLLDISRFKTPDVWGYFNADEALGVRTWDLYNDVIGAYGGRVEQLFAIGGDDEIKPGSKIKAERFKPVVHFIDVHKLKDGQTATHKIKLPPYFGSVKVMVIASSGKAYGSADKSVEVKKPLLVQMTTPRVISTEEEIIIPVTLFAMEDKIGKVDIQLSSNEYFTIAGGTSQTLTMNSSGEQMAYFRLIAGSRTGVGKLEVTVKSANDKSVNTIEIDVRNPNPMTTHSQSLLVNGGASVKMDFPYKGEKIKVELSTIPAINLTNRLDYLTTYPHGCIEQITSAAFPQLYINEIVTCDIKTVDKMEFNIKSTINRLKQYQLANGAFSYWNGAGDISMWGTIYAGHFLIEASKKGYVVNSSMKTKWKNYISKATFTNDAEQAYALYVLALNGTPERGTMNRMRGKNELSNEAKWFLAGAYTFDSKPAIANEIINNISTNNTNRPSTYAAFGSAERDMAVGLSVRTALGEREKAFAIVESLAKILNANDKWLSTQSTAWALNAIYSYVLANKVGGIDMMVGSQSIKTDKALAQMTTNDKNISFTNKGNGIVYAVATTKYVPQKGEELSSSKGVHMSVAYTDFDGKIINPATIMAGTDFFIDVILRNTSDYENYTNLALTHIFPSGWEVSNPSMNDGVTYQDVRDDRIYSYFDLKRGESKRIRSKATATYRGKFYLPSIYCEAMYDNTINATIKGGWVEVK